MYLKNKSLGLYNLLFLYQILNTKTHILYSFIILTFNQNYLSTILKRIQSKYDRGS